MTDRRMLERRVLIVSIAVSAVLGVLGVAWGIASGSQMILLDGVYGIIGIATSVLLLRASTIASAAPSSTYPFGRQAITPFVIGIQGLVLLVTLGYAAIEAAYAIAHGGSTVTAGSGVLYSVIVTVACLVTWGWLRRSSGSSELLRAETVGWRIAAFRGVGMLVGFTILALVTGSRFDHLAPYVDPVMVLVTCVAFLPAPLGMVRSTVLELLEGAPPPVVRRHVEAALDDVSAAFELEGVVVRMSKLGSKLYLEVEARARPDVTLGEVDRLRRDIVRSLDHLPYEVWLNLDLRPAIDGGPTPD
jgi:predicted Co/Zn/Cd cation transporter (cation efflux family)